MPVRKRKSEEQGGEKAGKGEEWKLERGKKWSKKLEKGGRGGGRKSNERQEREEGRDRMGRH
jgi:hypothetical protein